MASAYMLLSDGSSCGLVCQLDPFGLVTVELTT